VYICLSPYQTLFLSLSLSFVGISIEVFFFFEGVVDIQQRFLTERMLRIVDRIPLTVWVRAVVRVQARYETRERFLDESRQVMQTRSGVASPDLAQLGGFSFRVGGAAH